MLIRVLISMCLAFMIILGSTLIVYIVVQANECKLWANILMWLLILVMLAGIIYQII